MLTLNTPTATRAAYPSLAGKHVLVTGGAMGIGEALVEAFALQRAQVVFIDIADEPAEALIERLSADGFHSPEFRKCDLRDIEAVRSTLADIQGETGGIDILINNAANDDRHTISEITPEHWDERIAVNLRHLFFAAQAVVPGMRRSGGGAIINLGSISGTRMRQFWAMFTSVG